MINLKKYFEDGHNNEPEGLLAASSLSERKKDEVFTSMETHGSSILKPVYEALNKSVDYGELRILQLAYEAQQREKEEVHKLPNFRIYRFFQADTSGAVY